VTRVSVEVNGRPYAADVEPRLLLADFLRDHIQLTGTHIGCEHGVCGTCTVQVDGQPARSCLTLAVQVDGSAIRTVEGLAPPDGESLHPLQTAFREHHALQCGYCTPGFLMSIEPLLPELRGASDREVREQLSGNLCRCTGYQNIVEATQATVAELEAESAPAPERRTTVEATSGVPVDASRAWAAIQDPRGLLDALGVTGLAASEPNGWRGRLAIGPTTVDGVLELIDLDDDLRVANFALAGREVDGIGQVRGALMLSVDESTLVARLELELIGIAAIPGHEALQRRFSSAAAGWAKSLGGTGRREPELAPAARSRRRLARLGVALAVAGAAWLGWRSLQGRR
jgi:aerobic-type carbon monoxide dehydrogenase small subunit (CoxS/CutS family)